MKAEFFLQKIENDFPQLRWKEHRVVTRGWDHTIIVLDEKIVFRFPKDRGYRAALRYEIQLLGYLKKKAGVGIPKYDYVSKDKSFAGYGMLTGRELTCSQFRRLSAWEEDAVARQLASFISTLHATPKTVITRCNVRTENREKAYEDLVRDTRELLFPRFREEEIRLVQEYFGELEGALNHDYSDVLVHSDLGSEHILWDSRSKQINIIDFSDRALGDGAIDFTGLLEYGAEFTEKVLDLYCGGKDGQMLERSQLYFKRASLLNMIASMHGSPCTFEQGYIMFKGRFEV